MSSAATPAKTITSKKYSLSQESRLKKGREQRTTLNRSKLAELDTKKRKSDALSVLLGATEGRIEKLLPIKYGRMADSPFAFFRGAVSVMAADLADQPNTGLTVQLCGDAHLQNLGCFAAPDGRVIFDINDFDETIAGPWEWDVKRMAASIVLAGSACDHSSSACKGSVEAFVSSYIETLEELAELPIIEAARYQIHRASKVKAIADALDQAERATPLMLLSKYTEKSSSGKLQFRAIEHAQWRVQGAEKRQVLSSLDTYRQSLPPAQLHLCSFFQPVDVAFRIVGTGSVGLRDYVVLMDGNGYADPVFLQVKQEVKSAYASYLPDVGEKNQGQRAVDGQRNIQPFSDPLLGWTRIDKNDFLVRQLNDHKGSVDLTRMQGSGLTSLAQVAGELLARGHARSGDALMIKGYIGTGDKAMKALVSYGLKYADVTREDFDNFKKGIKEGRVKVQA